MDVTEDQVLLRLPADSAYLTVLRTATASLASRLDFTVDEIEDLRIAVDEACALVLPHTVNGADLECSFTLSPASLGVSVSATTLEVEVPAKDTFAWTLLHALVDDLTSTVQDGRMTVTLVKSKQGPP
jgi:serine/threonine-protein kinase RsbW